MSTTSELMQAIESARFNPTAMQRIVLEAVETTSGGINRVVDTTNPVAFTIESAVVCSSVHMQQAESLSRRQYPSLAQTQEELYLHMADVDYVGRFATPAIATDINILFKLEDIYRLAVQVGNTNIRKITIPRNTEITVAEVTLTAQYPIDIRVLPNKGLSVVYDENLPSPLQNLTTNVIDWFITRIGEDDFLNIKFDIPQFKITSYTDTVNLTKGFKKSYTFTDQFHYARAYIRDQVTGGWTEIRTTHADQVYDPNAPTLALRVDGSILTVLVPQVYVNNGLITDSIRLDIYTTLGPLEMRLENQPPSAYAIRWIDLGEVTLSPFSAPLNTIALSCYTNSSISGGTETLTLDALRDRVIDNAIGNPKTPITPAQFKTRVSLLGYDLVQNIDSVTDRVYLATRILPKANYDLSRTPANGNIQTFSTPLEALIGLQSTYWNGDDRLVMRPNTLFKNTNGVLTIVPDSLVTTLLALPNDQKIATVNANSYLYTPFHYVLDISGNTFQARPYHLVNPRGVAKFFQSQNENAELDVAIADYRVELLSGGLGYRITIATRSSATFKALDHVNGQVQVQMSYRPPGLDTRVVMRGVDITPVGSEEYVYQFDITTDFDITNKHQMFWKSFHQIDLTPRRFLANLQQDLDFVFIILDYSTPGLTTTDLDLLVQPFDLPTHTTFAAVTHETIRVRFGDFLERLWHRTRSVIGEENYERYATDVPAYYTEDVYERDVAGNIKIGYDAGTGQILVNKLHSLGDPVLDNGGMVVYRHRQGDIILDSNGLPTLVGGMSTRGMIRQIDLLMLEGSYFFATSTSTVSYRDSLPLTIRDWVIGDIDELADQLLERTDLFFYPKSTSGQITVITSDDNRALIEAAQAIRVVFVVDKEVFINSELRFAIERTSLDIISRLLSQTTIAISQMESTIHTTLGQDILSVEISPLTGGLKSFTVLDGSVLPQIGKEIVSLADGTIAVQDAISFEFIRAVS